MSDGPSIVHDWSRVQFFSTSERQWTKEEVIDFIIDIERRASGIIEFEGDIASLSRSRLSLVKSDG